MTTQLPKPPLKRGRPLGSTSFDPATAAAFGRVVRQARTAAGISQEALAYMAGLERSYFGRIERGKNQPTLYVILKVAAALGHEAGALVTMVERAMADRHDSKASMCINQQPPSDAH